MSLRKSPSEKKKYTQNKINRYLYVVTFMYFLRKAIPIMYG